MRVSAVNDLTRVRDVSEEKGSLKVTVRTDTTDKEVDAASFLNHLLVVSALSLQILSITIQNVDILLRAVDMVEEVAGHE